MLRVELLGGFRLSGECGLDGVLSNRGQSLVAYLALRAGEFVPRRRLAFLFWPDSNETQARTNLRQLLHHLRSAWPASENYLEGAAQNLRWRSDAAFELDAAQFSGAVAAAGDAMARRDRAAAILGFERAIGLYHGELLAGLYDDWIEPERARFRQMYGGALESLAGLCEQARDYAAAVRHAEALVAFDPLAEAAWQKLIRLHSLNGDRASAARAYETCAATLRRELNTEPCAATRRVRDEGADEPAIRSAATFVGRAREWNALADMWRQACAGRACAVAVTGEAGIGKTTLVRELAAAASTQGASIAEAACYPTERPMAYAVIADWLRSKALRPGLRTLSAAQQSQLSRVLPELLEERPEFPPPQPFTESWQRRHFFEALARAVWNAPQPLLLFLDDIQWCDPETIEWIEYLLRSNAKARLMVAATARFEEGGGEHVAQALRRLARNGQSAEIALEPLTAEETAELAARMSAEPVDPAGLYHQTGGNPLFIVETVRAGMVVSPKVQSVIVTRLGQLTAAARELAAEAAAIGRPFTVELLAAAGCGEESAIAASVDELFARRMAVSRDGRTYEFSHGQLREVAYAQLGPARRRLTHRRVAQALERSGAAESAEIASHYERAGEAVQAIAHWERASMGARLRYAEDEAIACLSRALQLLELLPPGRDRDRAELNLLVALGPSLMATQGYASAEAGRVYARARMLCELAGETGSWFPVLSGSWAFHVVKGELAASKEIATRFVRLARERSDADPALLAAGLFCLGSPVLYTGRLQESNDLMRECLEHYAARADGRHFFGLGPELSVFCRSHVSHALWLRGFPDRALAEIHATIDHARELSHPFSLALALAYAAMLHQFRGEPHAVEERSAEAAALCAKHDFRYYLAWTPILGGWARVRNGLADGLEQMRDGLAALRATGANLRAPYYLTLLAQACRESGRLDEGLAYAEEALAVGSAGGEAWVKSELERIKGDLLLDCGLARQAEEHYRAALRTAREQGALIFELRAAVALARIGATHEAAAVYSRFQEGFDTADLAQARSVFAATAG